MPPNAHQRPSGPFTHNSHAYGGQYDGASSSVDGQREAVIGSNSRHHSQGVVASHFLAQDRETWMDFLRDGTETTVNQQPQSANSSPAAASEARSNPSSSRYTLPNRPSPRTESSSSRSSDRKRRLTTADSPLRRPSSIRMHSENTGDSNTDPIVKCGRVVCASCSPHRITIPRQFIVHPPSESTANFIDLTGEDENAMSPFGPFRNPALGGGEEVRVCNPCVPDPNFSPPPRYDSLGHGSRPFPPRSTQVPSAPPPHPRAHRSSSSVHDASRFTGQGQTHGARDTSNESSQNRRVSYHGNSNIGERRLPPLPPSAIQQQHQHPHHRAPLISQTIANNRARQAQNHVNFGYGSFSGTSPFGQATSTPVPPPLQPQHAQPPRPRRQIPEEDECPICGEELPPKGPDGDDAERTQHIEECIALHSASPGPTAALNRTQTQNSQSLPTQRTRGMSSAGANLNNNHNNNGGEGASNLQNRMSHAARGMFPYVATEKDCVDEEGRVAECTICLEDFEAGDKMARLVCWCKFHETCIKEWWDKKGRGACPTHQLQE
ncbi:unnamed protein product [Alternaria alternata]